MEWKPVPGAYTDGWQALEHDGERLALVQPWEGRASIVLYNGPHPWKQKRVEAASVRQALRFAERWVRARLPLPTQSDGSGS